MAMVWLQLNWFVYVMLVFHVTICVIKVAASGGYMMACIANEIVSAPFAVVGSIGVVAQVPNFNRL